MSMKEWPYIPERLTEVLPEDLVSFIQSGSSVRMKMPTAIVELRPGDRGKNVPFSIPSDDKWLNFSSFCRYLRGPEDPSVKRNFPGGDETCRAFDEQQALKFLEGTLPPKNGHVGTDYACHMGLLDCVAPIVVGDRRVACIFAGQRRPTATATDDLSSPEKPAGKIGTTLMMGISIGAGSKQILVDLAKEAPLYSDDLLERLEKEAQRISEFAGNYRTLIKTREQENFLRELKIEPGADRDSLDRSLQVMLKRVMDWAPFSLVVVFLCDEPWQRTLKKVVAEEHSQSMPRESLLFNWRKAGLPRPGSPGIPSNVDHRRLVNGITGVGAASLIDSIRLIIPIVTASGHRAVVCFGGLISNDDLAGEREFLERLAMSLCSPYLEQLNVIQIKDREEQWEDAASLIGHQVRGSLHPISTEADIIRQRVLGHEDWVTDDRLREAINTIQLESTALADYATQALEFWKWIMGRGKKVFTEQSIANIVIGCVKRWRRFAEQNTLKIRIDDSINALPKAQVMGRTMEVAILNILENAIKYSFDNSNIIVTGSVTGNWVAVEVDNFGIGILDEERNKVFTKGFRGKHRGRKILKEGEGLGLWQAREILLAHGGNVTCASYAGDRQPRPGDVHGYRTVFTIALPITQRSREET